MKKCGTCKQTKSVKEFSGNKSKRDGLSYCCKPCKKQRDSAWYHKNKAKRIAKIRINTQITNKITRERLYTYLLCNPCTDCGERDIRVLEFDHVDPETKSHNIADMIKNKNTWASVLVEIDKCVVRCANCHRRKTVAEHNSTKQAFWLAKQGSMA